MKPTALIVLLGLALTGIVLLVRPREPAATGVSQATTNTIPTSGPEWTDDEVFRRAFWRHPTATDRVLHAERRELASEGAGEVQNWQWFIAVRPSPELLASLRDPETFGLASTGTARPWPTDPAPPDWFPAPPPAASTEFEVLQAGMGHLTILYRTRDNMLFATDTGGGFATAARALDGPANPPAP